MKNCLYNKIVDSQLHIAPEAENAVEQIKEAVSSFFGDTGILTAEIYMYRLASGAAGIGAADFEESATGKTLSVLIHPAGTFALESSETADLQRNPVISISAPDETDTFYLIAGILHAMGFTGSTVSKDRLSFIRHHYSD